MFWKRKPHPLVQKVFNVLLEKGFEGTYINEVLVDNYITSCRLHLPEHKESADLEKILPNLQEEVGATAVKLGKCSGKDITVLFGTRKLDNISFSSSMLRQDTLQIYFPSAYGEHVLDFEDGASCHALNGGVTRMGKTCLLLYLSTSLYVQNKGNLGLYISSSKLKDYYPFEGLPNVRMEKDTAGMILMLNEIIAEYKSRNELLYSPRFRKATDAKSIRKLYPEHYHLFKPIFLIIDEYARFSDSPSVQKMVTEIVETAGFVNIHVIIASQRPDATTVLKPRIRANLLTRIAFTTADKKNSEVILDRWGAEKLGRIAGRAILVDSDHHVIQVPYLDVVECDKLLEGYRNEQESKRQDDCRLPREIQSNESQPISLPSLQKEQQPDKHSEQSAETYECGWLYFSDSEGKG